MAEPVACCLRGIDNIGITQGDTVCIVGGGAIGQIMAQLARISGASKVVVSEPVEMRRDLAISLGADAAVDPVAGDLKEQLQSTIGKDYADVVIECVGRPVAVGQAVHIAGKGGKILLFSVPNPNDTFELPLIDVFQKELTIKGSFVNPDTQYRAASLISEKRLNLKPMANDSVKVVVLPQN